MNRLNSDFGTNIAIDRLRVSLISWDTSVRGIYIEDYKQDTLAYIHELSTSILSIQNVMKGNMDFGDVDIEGLDLKIKTYQDTTYTNLDVFIAKFDSGQPRDPDTEPFTLSTDEFVITDSRFRLINENLEYPSVFDLKKLNLQADNFNILGPDVSAKIESLAFRDRRGLEVDRLQTEFAYSLSQIRFDSLQIKTAHSDLKGQLIFDYEREDMKDFTNKVGVTSNFIDSEVGTSDINLFYDEFGVDKTILFSGDISGVLNDLQSDYLFLVTDNTGIRGDFNFTDLFQRDGEFKMEADIRNITSSYYQLRGLLPRLLGESLPKSVQKLGSFTMRGDAVVTTNTVQTKLNINSALGNSYVDLELSELDEIQKSKYKGFISLIDFDLGNYIENKTLGKATVDVNVEGEGFVKETLNTEVIGEIYNLTYNGYEYKDVKVSGILKDELYDGSISSNDANFKFYFKGLADFGSAVNNFNFEATVDYADLKKLNFIKDSISVFKGDITMDISGNSIDEFTGNIAFNKTQYSNKNDTYFFEDFKITSAFDQDSVRNININSPDIITGYMKGKFKVEELGRLTQNAIGSIYTNYKPYETSEGQELAFNFKIYNKIVEVFFPEVDFGPNTFIKGSIISDEGDLKLTFRSPNISAFGNHMQNIDVKIDNKNPLFNTYVSIDDVSTLYYDVKDFSLINTTLTDTLFFRTEFKGGSLYNDSYNLNFYHTFNENNNSVIGLKKSDVSFKGNTWVLNKDGNRQNKVILSRNLDSVTIDEIVMNNDNREQIRLRGKLADSTYKDLQLQFKIVSLDKIAPAIDSLNLSGEINGNLNILQKDNVYLPSCNLEVADFAVNDLELGKLSVGIVGNKDLTDFVVSSQIVENGREKLNIIGNVINKGEIPEANLIASFDRFALRPFSPLGEGVITNIRGNLNGTVQVQGDIRNPDIEGRLALDEAGIAIPYLNVDYDFNRNADVSLTGQTFRFNDVTLTDISENTRAMMNGTIKHKFWQDWSLDLDLATLDERFLILNTELEEEVLYYGSGFVNGTGKIFGPTQALTITFDGATGAGTELKIPISDVASVGDYSFINFVQRNRIDSVDVQRTLRDYEGLEMEFDLVVTPDAEVEIVVDPKTGSSLKGTGEGILLIEINTNGKFNMFGDFVVVTGEYRYKFGGIIDKTFQVEPGGSIVWEGDPLAAQLNMEAVYSLNANPAPLLDNNYVRRIPTDVVVSLTDELERPSIDFNIDFPGTSSIVKSELEYKLQDPTVEERNAFFLLAQGTFVDEGTGINQQAVTGNLIQTASGLLNQVLSSGNDKVDFGLSYEQGYLDPNSDNLNTENRIGVTVSTKISDRVLINGRFGVPVGGVSETVLAGDVEVQVLLNEEGTLRAKIFNRENEITQFLGEQQGYTQGLGLSYEVDFNSFKELMNKIFAKRDGERKKRKKDSLDISQRSVMGKDSLIQFLPKKSRPPKR